MGGYSWKQKKFVIWVLHFNAGIKQFTFRPLRGWPGSRGMKQIAIEGDHVKEARQRLVEKLRKKNKLPQGGFDMEPFEVLRDMCRSGLYPEIGGAPQLVKVYQHMNVVPYAVYWPNKSSKKVSLLGRPLLDYEVAERLILDPDDLTNHVMLSRSVLQKIVAEKETGEPLIPTP